MFQRELKINRKSVMIWSIAYSLIFIFVFAMYPYIIENSKMDMDEMLAMFPQEMLDAFNMTSIATASGWVNSEGMLFVVLGLGIFSSILGANALYREKKDATIEYLASKPVTRNQIMYSKVFADLICILIVNCVIAATILIGLKVSDDLDFSLMAAITMSPLVTYLVLYFLNLTVSLLFKGTMGLSIAIPFVFYILLVISKMADFLEPVKYFTPFTICDAGAIIKNDGIEWIGIIIGLLLSIVLCFLSSYIYNKKELV